MVSLHQNRLTESPKNKQLRIAGFRLDFEDSVLQAGDH